MGDLFYLVQRNLLFWTAKFLSSLLINGRIFPLIKYLIKLILNTSLIVYVVYIYNLHKLFFGIFQVSLAVFEHSELRSKLIYFHTFSFNRHFQVFNACFNLIMYFIKPLKLFYFQNSVLSFILSAWLHTLVLHPTPYTDLEVTKCTYSVKGYSSSCNMPVGFLTLLATLVTFIIRVHTVTVSNYLPNT